MLLIQNCNLVDMAGTFQEKRDLLIDGGKVARVAPSIRAEEGWEVIDAAGRLVCGWGPPPGGGGRDHDRACAAGGALPWAADGRINKKKGEESGCSKGEDIRRGRRRR